MKNRNFLESVKIPFAGSLVVHGLILLSLGTFILSKAKPEMRIIPIEIIQMAEEKAPEPEKVVQAPPPPVVQKEEPPPPEPVKEVKKREPVVKPEKKKEPQPVKEAIEEKEVESAMAPMPAETVATAHHEEHSDHAEHAVAQAVAPRSTGTAQELDEMQLFKNLVRQKIERAKFYPQVARRRGYEGAVGVRFTIQSDGGVENVEVVAPCNCDILNKAACNAVMEAAPYPPMPDSVKGPVRMEINLAYQLN